MLLDESFSILKICDFGTARYISKVADHTSGVGTYVYMAPEVLAASIYTSSADVYSMAITIWELFAAERVHLDRNGPFSLMKRIIENGFRPDLSKIRPKAVANVIGKCWSTDSAKRMPIKALYEFFHSFKKHPQCKTNWIKEEEYPNSEENDEPTIIPVQFFGHLDEKTKPILKQIVTDLQLFEGLLF